MTCSLQGVSVRTFQTEYFHTKQGFINSRRIGKGESSDTTSVPLFTQLLERVKMMRIIGEGCIAVTLGFLTKSEISVKEQMQEKNDVMWRVLIVSALFHCMQFVEEY